MSLGEREALTSEAHFFLTRTVDPFNLTLYPTPNPTLELMDIDKSCTGDFAPSENSLIFFIIGFIYKIF